MRKSVVIAVLFFGIFAFVWDFTSSASTTVTVESIQRWSVTDGFYALNVFSDGSILAAQPFVVNKTVSSARLNPSTGALIASYQSPDVRTSIRLSTGDQDWVVGGWEDRSAYAEDGSFLRILRDLGCCNIPRHPMALDPLRDAAYVQANGELFGMNMSTGVTEYHFYGVGDTFGMISISDTNTLYTAGRNGNVTRLHPVNGRQWLANIDNGDLQPGAVAADGSFIVTSGSPHFAADPEPTPSPGRLARIDQTGTVTWNLVVNAVTPPVIGSNGLVFVGTQAAPIDRNGVGAIEAYDLATGNLVWSTPVQGLPNDLLVGDDGAVYVGTGAFTSGNVYALAQGTGEIRLTVTNVPGTWEIILRAGLLYSSGSSITALPVDANNYDLNSPWPVRFHDNQRTSNRQAPILTPPRILPVPTPTPTPTYQIEVLFDQTKAHKSGSAVPIKIQLFDANGENVSCAALLVHAINVVQVSNQATASLDEAGNANPDLDFRYDAALGGYVFNLKTTDYSTGSYALNLVVGNGTTIYSVGFQVRR